MDKDYLALKRASISRPSGEWNDDGFDVLCDGVVVGRIMKVAAAPVGEPWLWTLAFGQHEDRWPTHGYEPTREAASICEELAAGVTARARRADRQVESAAWTARGGLVRDERWRPPPHRRCQGRKNSARQSVRALLFRL